ncbi:uncharacterized protein LOC144004036 isoform X3 [Festucalex cinctus]
MAKCAVHDLNNSTLQASLENELTAWPRVVVSILDKTKGGSPKAALNCASLVTLKGGAKASLGPGEAQPLPLCVQGGFQ